MASLSTPHGGILVNRVLTGEARQAALQKAQTLKKVALDEVAISDLELLATGVFYLYEPTENPGVICNTEQGTPEERAEKIMVYL